MARSGKKPSIRTCGLPARKELEEYRKLFAALPDIIYRIDANGCFTYISESVRDLGYGPAELIGRHFSEIIHPADVESISRDKVLPRLKGKQTGDNRAPKLFDERRTGPRGTRSLIVRFVPKYLKARISADEADPALQFYGEVIAFGDYLSSIIRRNSGPLDSHNADFSGVVYGEVSANGQFGAKQGKRPYRFEGSAGIIRNITDRILLEQQRDYLEAQLQHSLRMEAIGQLAGSIAHDLNNVLCNILGYAELIRENHAVRENEVTDPELARRIDRMIKAINNGITLIRNMLDFSRKTTTEKTILSMHAVVGEVTQLLSLTIGKMIQIAEEQHSQNPYVMGDLAALQSSLINIAMNARDAMPNGGELTFKTENVMIAEPLQLPAGQKCLPGEYVLVSIVDTGCGIEEPVMSRIFEPFFTTKPLGKGTGLGLSNVLRTVKNHGGFVDVVSAPDKGATFKLYLPATMAQESSQARAGASMKNDAAPLRLDAHVLVVDDDSSVCDIMRIALQNAGCRVTMHSSAVNALEAYRRLYKDIDLVLVDMLMPEMSGLEFMRLLRTVNPDAKALLVTGLSDDLDRKRVADKGFIGTIKKPFNIRQLIQDVSAALSR